jgi:hypothetical protein
MCVADGIFPWTLIKEGANHAIWVAGSSFSNSTGLEIPAEVWLATENSDAILLEPMGNTFTERRLSELESAFRRLLRGFGLCGD